MDVSILIPLYNRLDLTRACLQSLAKTAGHIPHEVILIDDGSTDGTREFLATLPSPQYRVILNGEPRGYAANNNAAARLASAPVLCLLNNDTSLLPGWLEAMLRVLRRAPKAGCIGNVQREPYSGLIDHIGVYFNAEGNPVHAGKNDPAPPPEEYARWPAVTGACCVLAKDLFASLGGFDEAFRNGFEDVDFCLRTAEAGCRHYVANCSMIYHYISASPGRRLHEDANLARYRQLWGARIQAFFAERQAQLPAWRREHAATARAAEDVWRQQWELSREQWKNQRTMADQRADGLRYLRKHASRPWRYNLGRVYGAIGKVAFPRPLKIRQPPPMTAFTSGKDGSPRLSEHDWMLFDPPQT